MLKRIPLHWQILGGMVVGTVIGLIAVSTNTENFFNNWLVPFGDIFVRLLKLIAIPLIIASLIKGISDLKDISRFSSIGFRTIGLYVLSTLFAVTMGIVVVSIIQPGKNFSEDLRQELVSSNSEKAMEKMSDAASQMSQGPLQFLVDMVPDNIFGAASSNGNMLQVIFFVILFGISLILVDPKRGAPVKHFFDSVNDVILKMIDLIMLYAPIGVAALMTKVVLLAPKREMFVHLGLYGLSVLIGLFLMVVLYVVIVNLYTRKSPFFFLKGISPAQLLAFSTSSSAATLPVTMERVEEHLGVEKQVSSFVLPVGATINMDGTSLYQAVAAVFIANIYGMDLTMGNMLTILLTATLASIGSAAVPGAGMVMLVIVLSAIGVPEEGLAFIIALDRPLDMCRTVVNVTGDATVSMVVAKSTGMLGEPHVENWDDNYESVK